MGKYVLYLLVGTLFSLGTLAETPTTGGQTYTTVSNGNWSSPSTWAGGQVPPAHLTNNKKVVILHDVTYNLQNDLDIDKGWVSILGGSLVFPQVGNGSGRSIFVKQHGDLLVFAGELLMPINSSSSGNIKFEKGKGTFVNSIVSIAQNWQEIESHVKLILSCIRVGENYQLDKAHLWVDRSCIEIGLQGSGNFQNDKGHVKVNNAWFLLRGQSGNFENKDAQSKITEYENCTVGIYALDVPGNLENNGLWQADVLNYCVDQNIQGSRHWDIDFMGPENCPLVNSLSCDCDGIQESPLPVDLISFSGSVVGSVHKLNWRVANEVDLQLYEVERSTDGRNFVSVGNVPATGSSTYQFSIDAVGSKAYYRLKMIDLDGSVEYSRVLMLNNKQEASIQVAPNPFRDQIMINLNIEEDAVYNLRLIDMNGKLVKQKNETLSRGMNSVGMTDLDKLNPGMYTLIVSENTFGTVKSYKLVKQ